MKDSENGIVLDEKNQEQPQDKERAQQADVTEPGRTPHHPVKDNDKR